MNGKPLVAVEGRSVLRAFQIFDDKTQPRLLDFAIDMNAGILHMRMSESVNIASIATNVLKITNGYKTVEVDYYESHTFSSQDTAYTVGTVVQSGPSYSDSDDGPEVTVTLGRRDLNELKRLLDTATGTDNTHLTFDAPFIADMNGNSVELWQEHAAQAAISYTPDTTPPTLMTFDIDLDQGLLYLNFDETVPMASFTGAEAITLHPEAVAGGDDGVVLSSDSKLVSDNLPYAVDSALLTVALSTMDLWRIKNRRDLLATSYQGFVTIAMNTVTDMMGAANIAPALTAQSREVVHDTVMPILQNFKVNLVSGTIAMSFNEPVDPTTVNMGDARFQAEQVSKPSVPKYQLHLGTGVTEETGTLLTVSMSPGDMTSLQEDLTLLHSIDDTYLSFDRTIVDDMAVPANDVFPISKKSAKKASEYLYYDYATVTNIGPDSGNPGGNSLVTITGTGFLQKDLRDTSRTPEVPLPVAVYVNKVKSNTVVVVDDTTLTFKTPPVGNDENGNPLTDVALEVEVKVDNALTTAAMGFTYLNPPRLEGISPVAGSINGGTRVTMSGKHFGEDESTNSMSYIRAFFGDGEATHCTVDGGDVICNTPAHLDSCATDWPGNAARCKVDVTVSIDGALTTLDGIFEYLPTPTLLALTPLSGHFDVETNMTVYGNNFGPLTATNDYPDLTLLVGDRACTEGSVEVVEPTAAELVEVGLPAGTEKFTCRLAKGHGPAVAHVGMDGTVESGEGGFIFTDYNDAGKFTFDKVTHYVNEEVRELIIFVSRSPSDHPSPATLTITPRGWTQSDIDVPNISSVIFGGTYYQDVKDGEQIFRPPVSGTAEDGWHDGSPIVLDFPENVFAQTFTFSLPGQTRNPADKRAGYASDAAILLEITNVRADHGDYSVGVPTTILIEAPCSKLSSYCNGNLATPDPIIEYLTPKVFDFSFVPFVVAGGDPCTADQIAKSIAGGFPAPMNVNEANNCERKSVQQVAVESITRNNDGKGCTFGSELIDAGFKGKQVCYFDE
jgi:hypothetical protein